MRIVLLFVLLLPSSLLPSATFARKTTTTVTVTEPRTTVSVTEFLLPTIHYQSVLRAGPLRTCFQTISAEKNWFAVAWESGKFLDNSKCKQLRKGIRGEVGKGLSNWRCFWYFDSRTGTGVTKAQGEFKSKVGKMENVIEKAVREIWGEEGAEQCRSI